MDKNKTIFDYLSILFRFYGITILLLNIFSILVGDKAQGISSIYAFGSRGLSNSTMLEFFLLGILLIALRVLFFTDMIIKKSPIAARIALMFGCGLAVSVAFAFFFDWFPVTDIQAWAKFGLGVVIGGLASACIAALAEKQANKKLEEALKRNKETL